jgi:hypothetical protein
MYVSRLSTSFLSTNMFYLSARNSEKKTRKELQMTWLGAAEVQFGLAHRLSGAPGQPPVNRPLSGKVGGVRL